ncbi:hypothetical protein [Xenorhabdus cabanillasii]|uniref:Uncharacterized protein n=1 Tax=Xenorhabdus cabanillasii JM26 TaxID=1427517 RepID=W1INH8_9GAMM|nr:hypothetical protein [Xenorhabdus cabanillasii]PHM75904.1 hypothetical protein Xcab_03600 [Xenorhabdus cabanillasii JM26]CDL79974.1 hypothetical protein XCR1_1300020 [Xenorhabdus cabanillasii JM26]
MNNKEEEKKELSKNIDITELLKFSQEIKKHLTAIIEEIIKSEYDRKSDHNIESKWESIYSILSTRRLIEICNAIDSLAEFQKNKPVAYMVLDEIYNEVITYKGNEEIANKIAEVHNSSELFNCKVIPLYCYPQKNK